MSPPQQGASPQNPFVFESNGLRDQTVKVEVANSEEDNKPTADEDLLERAQEDFRRCISWESPWRQRAEEELKFVDGLEHWDGAMKEERKGRPCLTFDRIGPAIDQVVNDARQNPPEPKIRPVGGGADKETAEILQGLLRNIDQDSSAAIAYLTAYEHAVKIGRGAWRIHFEFENDHWVGDDLTPEAFIQKLVVQRIANPFSVYPDPASDAFDYTDMRFCFVTEDMSLEAFKSLYPKSKTATYSNFEGVGDKIRTEWFPRGTVRVAEYWWVETEHENIAQLNTGQVMLLSEVPQGANVINRRRREKRTVHMAKLTGAEVLEQSVWPGKFIPIVVVNGREVIKDGKRTLRGMIRTAMDSNLAFDYMMSKEVETVALSSIVQWMVAEGQIENFEYQWTQANRKALPFLEYRTEVGGKAVPPPQRIFSTPPLGAISESIAHMDEATKMNTATWNPSLGGPSPEASGRAITARQRESDNAHFNFHDNLMRAIRHSARVELDLIPHIYSEARMITILDPDGSNRDVAVNQPLVFKGQQRIFALAGPARYDVTVDAAPSYASRRAEGADKLIQAMQFIPGIGMRAPDLVVKALDIPDGDIIADRVRPPDVQVEQDGSAPPIPPQIQGLIAQQHQMIVGMSQRMQGLEQIIKEKLIETASKERIATQTNLARAYSAEVSAKSAVAQQLAQQDHAHVENELDRRADLVDTHISLAADIAQTERELQHDAEQNEQDRQHQQQLQEQQQQQQQAPPEPQPPQGQPSA